MKLFALLNEEMKHPPVEGTFAPYYFRYLGYREHIADVPAMFQAAGVHALFSRTKAVILKNELFAGNTYGLCAQADPMVLEYAEQRVCALPSRNFSTNKDHFSPDYRKILSLGLPGLIAAVDTSMENHKADPKKMDMLQAMKHTLLGFRQMICNYIEEAEHCKQGSGYDVSRLDFIIENSKAILDSTPRRCNLSGTATAHFCWKTAMLWRWAEWISIFTPSTKPMWMPAVLPTGKPPNIWKIFSFGCRMMW